MELEPVEIQNSKIVTAFWRKAVNISNISISILYQYLYQYQYPTTFITLGKYKTWKATGVLPALCKQRFFSTQPQCCLTFTWIELQMFLWCWLIHISISIVRHLIFIAFVFMSNPRSIYVVSMWSFFFHFHFHFCYDNLMSTDTLVLLLIF